MHGDLFKGEGLEDQSSEQGLETNKVAIRIRAHH